MSAIADFFTSVFDLAGPSGQQAQLSGMSNGILRVGSASYNASWSWARTMNTVYANATAYRCVEQIVADFIRPEWEVTDPSTGEEIENSPIKKLLHNPWPGMSGTLMQELIARDKELNGKTFWLMIDGSGNVVDPEHPERTQWLRRLPTQRVSVLATPDDDLVGFVYKDAQGRSAPFHRGSVLYSTFAHPDRPYDGIAPAMMAGIPSDTDTAASKFNLDLLNNDGALPGYIVVENLTPDQYRGWVAMWRAGEVPGKTRIFGGENVSYTKVGQSNKDMMYDALRAMSQQDICRAFGVPHVLIDPTDATFANGAQARDNYVQSTVLSKWVKCADDFTTQLGRAFGVDIGFDLDDVEELSEGEDAVVARAVQLLQADAITVNEWRADQGLDPVPWGDVPLSYVRQLTAPPVAGMPDQFPAAIQPGLGVGVVEPDLEETEKALDALELEIKALMATKAPTKRTVRLHDFDGRVTKYEARTKRVVKSFFDRQAKVVVAKIRGKSGKSLTKALQESSWWDQQRWDDELGDEAETFLDDTTDAFGTAIMAQLPTSANFDSQGDRVKRYVDQRSSTIASLVNDTTAEDIRRVIADGTANGDSIDDIASSVQGYFSDQADMRAERVARTETIDASNFGLLEGARQSGVASGKTWLASADAEDDCSTLDGETVAIDDTFGDVDQPPLHPNCRCSLLIVTDSGDETEEDSGE